MSKIFLFLELTDPWVNGFFQNIDRLVAGKPQSFPVHITVRGPFKYPVPPSTLNACIEKMQHDVLRISGAGIFLNPKENVVYLGVDSANLRKIWRKPDFPISRYGFNPHISVYRGSDDAWAQTVFRFFQEEAVEIFTADFRFRQYVAKQGNLKVDTFRIAGDRAYYEDARRIRPEFLDRLARLPEKHRAPISNPVQHSL